MTTQIYLQVHRKRSCWLMTFTNRYWWLGSTHEVNVSPYCTNYRSYKSIPRDSATNCAVLGDLDHEFHCYRYRPEALIRSFWTVTNAWKRKFVVLVQFHSINRGSILQLVCSSPENTGMQRTLLILQNYVPFLRPVRFMTEIFVIVKKTIFMKSRRTLIHKSHFFANSYISSTCKKGIFQWSLTSAFYDRF